MGGAVGKRPVAIVAAPDGSSATLAALLGRVGLEMEGASLSLQVLQDTLADLRPDSLSAQAIVGLQALDLAEQTVRALATVVHALSAAVPAKVMIDAGPILATCEISALAERLAGAAGTTSPQRDAEFF